MTSSSPPRLLLLSRTAPGYPGPGGIFLQDLWDAHPSDRIAGFVVARHPRHLPKPGQSHLTGELAPSPRTTSRWGFLGTLAGYAVRHGSEYPAVERLSDSILTFVKAHRVQVLWAVLNDPLIIRLAPRVARRAALPLRPTIWDPPEALADKLKMDRGSRRALLQDFRLALEISDRCGVISRPMAEEYQAHYGIDPVVLTHGMASELRWPPAKAPCRSDELVLGFAGTPYAGAEWRALIRALDEAGWIVAGRRVRIRTLGHEAPFLQGLGQRVELLGWRPVAEVVKILAETTDITYLPYWIDSCHTASVKLCFPTKLTTYLAAGRPVLFHGPTGCSPDRFFERYPVGPRCHSHDSEDILRALTQVAADSQAYACAAREAARAATEELSQEVFHRRFRRLVEISS